MTRWGRQEIYIANGSVKSPWDNGGDHPARVKAAGLRHPPYTGGPGLTASPFVPFPGPLGQGTRIE